MGVIPKIKERIIETFNEIKVKIAIEYNENSYDLLLRDIICSRLWVYLDEEMKCYFDEWYCGYCLFERYLYDNLINDFKNEITEQITLSKKLVA